jgi:hypothetical protein
MKKKREKEMKWGEKKQTIGSHLEHVWNEVQKRWVHDVLLNEELEPIIIVVSCAGIIGIIIIPGSVNR